MSGLTIVEAVQEFLYDISTKKQERTRITYQTALNHFQTFLKGLYICWPCPERIALLPFMS